MRQPVGMFNSYIKLLVPFSAFLVIFAVDVPAQDFLPDLVRRIKPSAVAIETFDSRGNSLSRGSGFFTAVDRIITNRHVIERSSRVEVHLLDGKKFPVKGVIAIDGEGDLANFVGLTFALGERFDADARFPWAAAILNNRDLMGRLKVARLLEAAEKHTAG